MNYLISNIQNIDLPETESLRVHILGMGEAGGSREEEMRHFLDGQGADADSFAIFLAAYGSSRTLHLADRIYGSRQFYPDLRYELHLPEGEIECEDALLLISAASHDCLLHRILAVYAAEDTPRRLLAQQIGHLSAQLDAIAAAENPVRPQSSVPAKLAQDMHLSETMRLQLGQLLMYCRAAGTDAETTLRQLYEEGRLPCRDKKEGKRILDELSRKLV